MVADGGPSVLPRGAVMPFPSTEHQFRTGWKGGPGRPSHLRERLLTILSPDQVEAVVALLRPKKRKKRKEQACKPPQA
jgi:hypothetical protein